MAVPPPAPFFVEALLFDGFLKASPCRGAQAPRGSETHLPSGCCGHLSRAGGGAAPGQHGDLLPSPEEIHGYRPTCSVTVTLGIPPCVQNNYILRLCGPNTSPTGEFLRGSRDYKINVTEA